MWEQAVAIGSVMALVTALAVIIIQQLAMGKQNEVIGKLTQGLTEIANNPAILNAIEPLANAIPPVVLEQLVKGGALVKSFTPDPVDRLVDAFELIMARITDGKPNQVSADKPAEATVTTTTKVATTNGSNNVLLSDTHPDDHNNWSAGFSPRG